MAKFWNRGGSPSGTPAADEDGVFGATDRLKGNRGKVKRTYTSFGDDWVEVEWIAGPKSGTVEHVRQWEVAATNLF